MSENLQQIPQPKQPSPSPIQNSKPKSKSKKRARLIVGVVILVVLLAGGSAFAYKYQQQKAATNKFNTLALQIKNQELAAAQRYTKISALANEVTDSSSLDTDSSSSSNQLNTEADKITVLANQGCSAENTEVTSTTIGKQMDGLALSTTQRQYMSDMKQVLDATKDSAYADGTFCHDGKLVGAIASNIAAFVPGLQIISSISGNPTATQMNELKTDSTKSIVDQAALQATLPKATAFFTDMKQALGDAYTMFQAVNNGDLATAEQDSAKLETLGSQIDTDSQAITPELANLDKTEDSAVKKASQLEIAAINYQRSHNVTNANIQLDYALPVFRIADAVVADYSDAHADGSFPYGTSAQDLVSIDPSTMQPLQSKGLLKYLTYQSLGSDRSGFSLSAKLSDGSKLSEQSDPSTSQPT